MVAVLFIVFLVALAIGVPVAFSLGLASVAYMLGSHIQMINFAQYFFKGLDSFTPVSYTHLAAPQQKARPAGA